MIFFFKQKTAYEMPNDWSSDVCSSDLDFARDQQDGAMLGRLVLASVASGFRLTINVDSSNVQPASEKDKAILHGRSEERRVGKECIFRGAPSAEHRYDENRAIEQRVEV